MTSGVIGWVVTCAPRGRSASLIAFMIAPGAAPVPDFADAFGAELELRRRLDVGDIDVGHLRGHRHEVVGHGGVQ